MEKILTLFERDPESRRCIDKKTTSILFGHTEGKIVAYEKLDGMNVRVTVRKERVVRVEKRRNPTKEQKGKGIIEPWYIDVLDTPRDWISISPNDDGSAEAVSVEKTDAYLVDAARNTDLLDVPDGEYSGEAVGPKIQGNPLGFSNREILLFSLRDRRALLRYEDVPQSFEALRAWLGKADSVLAPGTPPEGIVWWYEHTHGAFGDQPVAKIKRKDFGL